MPTEVTIQGITFSYEPRYAEGHVLNEGEAKALNQTMKENIRNNFAQKVKAFQEGAVGEDIIRASFEDYVANYKFSDRQIERQPANKVEQIHNKLLKEVAEALCRKNNTTFKELSESRQDALLETLRARRPELLDEAKRRFEQLQSISADALEDVE